MGRVSAFDRLKLVPKPQSAKPVETRTTAPVARTLGPQPNLFANLNARQAEIIRSCSESSSLKKGDLLFFQGTPHNGIFIIQSGIIRTFFVAPKGREITLAYWRPGNMVGTPEVLSAGVHLWSGEAVVPCEVLHLKASTLRSLVMEMPQLALAVIEALEFKGKCFSGIVQMLATMTVSERIMESLRTLAEVYGTPAPDGTVLKAPFTHEAIASMVGASRQWVTMELHKLQKQGIIRIRNRAIVVIAPERLHA